MQNNRVFFRLGTQIYAHRYAILVSWILLILSCLPFTTDLTSAFKTTGFVNQQSASAKTDAYLSRVFNYNKQPILMSYSSTTLRADNPVFMQRVKKSLEPLRAISREHTLAYPDTNPEQISNDQHTAIVILSFTSDVPLAPQLINQIKSLIKTPPHISMELGGEPMLIASVNKQTQTDLYKGDLISVPVSLIALIVVFGSLTAACLPIVLGGGCALLILTTLFFLGHIFTLSIFTLNIALLLGLCLSLDYSLFIISRFRAELLENTEVSAAIAITLATAGKSVFFSGLAVFVSLSALLIFPINLLFSVGVGGIVAVFFAVLLALLLLPAILSLLGSKINALRLLPHRTPPAFRFWRRLAQTVVKHPLVYCGVLVGGLLFLGYPLLKVRLGISDVHILPAHAEGRAFFERYTQKFDQNALTPILLVVSAPAGDILSPANLRKLSVFVQRLQKNASVATVNRVVNHNRTAAASSRHVTPGFDHPQAPLLRPTTNNTTMISLVSKYPANSAATKALIIQLRSMHPGEGLTLQLTGTPVNNLEVVECIRSLFPYALVWIVVLTYLILLLLLRSLFLPLKAILMNILSLSASYGMLVFVFQQGHLHKWLNFEPQGMLDISLLIVIFCALFGFSMDYEVFLLTRIKEFYEKTGDNKKSIIFGIDHSSAIITGAAMIVIFICGAFMVADVLMVKEFGLGIAVAIFVDAFLVRSLLVPATMTLLNQLNWYCPAWLEKILPKC